MRLILKFRKHALKPDGACFRVQMFCYFQTGFVVTAWPIPGAPGIAANPCAHLAHIYMPVKVRM